MEYSHINVMRSPEAVVFSNYFNFYSRLNCCHTKAQYYFSDTFLWPKFRFHVIAALEISE